MGYFGNNFGNNWTYSSSILSVTAGPTGNRQQIIEQPFQITVFNSIRMGVFQERFNSINLGLCNYYFNNFVWKLQNYLSQPTLKFKTVYQIMKGTITMKTSIITFNVYKRKLFYEQTNTINLKIRPISEFLLDRFKKLNKIKEIVKMASSIGTGAELTTIIYRTSGSTDRRFDINDECDDYDGQEWNIDDPDRPELPLHPNCECYWEDGETGENLGQDLLEFDGEPNPDFEI